MNNKDREALDKFVDEDYLSSEDTKRFSEMSDGERATFIAERFFEAGAKHGRSQLNEIRDDNMSELYEIIKKLQEENKKLRECVEFYADKLNWYDNTQINGSDQKAIFKDSEDCLIKSINKHIIIGGKRARQVLNEIGEE